MPCPSKVRIRRPEKEKGLALARVSRLSLKGRMEDLARLSQLAFRLRW